MPRTNKTRATKTSSSALKLLKFLLLLILLHSIFILCVNIINIHTTTNTIAVNDDNSNALIKVYNKKNNNIKDNNINNVINNNYYKISDQSCRIVLHNSFEYHYEVIESVALLYPTIPLHNISKTDNCTISPLIVDIAMIKRYDPKFDGWYDGFVKYFNTSLKNQGIVLRKATSHDHGPIPIIFGSLIDLRDNKTILSSSSSLLGSSSNNNILHVNNFTTINYNARIEISCDSMHVYKYERWLTMNPRHYCVMHGNLMHLTPDDLLNGNNNSELNYVFSRSCWVYPFNPVCNFLPSILPNYSINEIRKELSSELINNNNNNGNQFYNIYNNTFNNNNNKTTIFLCAPAGRSSSNILDHAFLLKTLPHIISKYNSNSTSNISIQLIIFGRHNRKTNKINFIYSNYMKNNKEVNIDQNNNIIVNTEWEPDYIKYNMKISLCSIFLPLITPKLNPQYFESQNGNKLSGSVSQIIGHSVPTLIHKDLKYMYDKYWTNVVGVYDHDNEDEDDGINSFMNALDLLLFDIVV